MRAALYARVSTERQADRGTIGSQLAVLREHVAAAGDELVGEYVDDGHSGARLDRPGLDALRDAAEAGLFERVWCLSPDRLARAYAYQVLVLDELARSGSPWHSPTRRAAADDPQARLLTQVQGVIAEYEKAKIAERYRRGKLFRARAGEIVTWRASYGYRRIPRSRATGRPTWRSTNPRPRWCAGSSPTAPPASPSARSVAGSSPTGCRHRPANPSGATPRSAGCCATRPTSAGCTSTAPKRCPTGAPTAATGRSRAAATSGSRSSAAGSSRRAVPGRSRVAIDNSQVEPPPRRTRPVAAQGPGQMRCLRCRHQLPQDARPQRHLAPLLLLPQPRPDPRRRRRTPLPRTQHPRRRARRLRLRPHPRRAHPARPLLAGEQAVALRTPIPDDELLSRRTGPAGPQDRRHRRRTAPPGRPLPGRADRTPRSAAPRHRSRRPPKRAAAKRTSLAPERTALARDNQLRRRVHDLPPASTPSSTNSTTSRNNNCCAYSSRTSASPAGTSRSGSASRWTRHHPTRHSRPAQQANHHQPAPSVNPRPFAFRWWRRLRRGARAGRSWRRRRRRRRRPRPSGRRPYWT